MKLPLKNLIPQQHRDFAAVNDKRRGGSRLVGSQLCDDLTGHDNLSVGSETGTALGRVQVLRIQPGDLMLNHWSHHHVPQHLSDKHAFLVGHDWCVHRGTDTIVGSHPICWVCSTHPTQCLCVPTECGRLRSVWPAPERI